MDASNSDSVEKDQSLHYLRVRLGKQNILIILNQIQMVLPILELQTIPTKDAALVGILNYHGQPIPIYHLALFINEAKPQYDLNTLLVITKLSTSLVGFLTTEKVDIIDIAENQIQKTPFNKNMPYVTGLIENDEWSAWILDLEELVQFHQSELEKSHV